MPRFRSLLGGKRTTLVEDWDVLAVLFAAASGNAQYFLDALARMNGVAQPPYVSYEVVVRATGAQYYIIRDPITGNAEYGFSVGHALGETDNRWNVYVRTRDETTAVQFPNAYAITHFPVLNATWGGIDDWMRFGIAGRAATRVPEATPSPVASTGARVIAVVHAFSTPEYDVRGGEAAMCDNGSAGRIFYLRAKFDPYRHPATDVTVDNATHTVCTIRFELQHNDIVDRDGFVELHLAKTGGVYMVRRGEISFVARPKLGGSRVRIFIDYVGIHFPASPPAGVNL